MPRFEIICLANSRKHGGRCVAGLRTDGSGWLRPVGKLPDGTLYPPDYTLDDGSEAGILDVISLGVKGHRPAPHQPENWVTDGTTWKLVSRPMDAKLVPCLKNRVSSEPELIQSFSDRIAWDDLQSRPASASLELIAPQKLDAYSQMSYRGKLQVRGRFWLGKRKKMCIYDLVVTDPVWETLVTQRGPVSLKQTDSPFLVCISVGEPLGLYCYKLIAAIILLPPELHFPVN